MPVYPGAQAHSSLPHDQNNGGNLSCQGQPCHAFAHESRIELCQRARLDRSHHRRPLEQVLQIVIAVLVQPTNLYMLLLPSQLAFRNLMVGAGTGHHTKTAIGPKLPLGTEPVRSLQNAQQLSGSNRTNRWNLTQLSASRSLRTSWRNLLSASSCWYYNSARRRTPGSSIFASHSAR